MLTIWNKKSTRPNFVDLALLILLAEEKADVNSEMLLPCEDTPEREERELSSESAVVLNRVRVMCSRTVFLTPCSKVFFFFLRERERRASAF
jgi:hypothetical protein